MNQLHTAAVRLRRDLQRRVLKEPGQRVSLNCLRFAESFAVALEAGAYQELLEEWRRVVLLVPERGVPVDEIAKAVVMCWAEFARTKQRPLLELFFAVVDRMKDAAVAVRRCTELLLRLALHFDAPELLREVAAHFSLRLVPGLQLYGYCVLHSSRRLAALYRSTTKGALHAVPFQLWTGALWHVPHFILKNLRYAAGQRQFELQRVRHVDLPLLGVLVYCGFDREIAELCIHVSLDAEVALFAAENSRDSTLRALLGNRSVGLGSVRLEKLFARGPAHTRRFLAAVSAAGRAAELAPTLDNVRVALACGLDLNEFSRHRLLPLDRQMVELLLRADYVVPLDRYVAADDRSFVPCLGLILESDDCTEVLQHCMNHGRKELARLVVAQGHEFCRATLARHPAYAAFSSLFADRFDDVLHPSDLQFLSLQELSDLGTLRSSWKAPVVREFRRRLSLEPAPKPILRRFCFFCSQPLPPTPAGLPALEPAPAVRRCTKNAMHQVHATCAAKLDNVASLHCRSCLHGRYE